MLGYKCVRAHACVREREKKRGNTKAIKKIKEQNKRHIINTKKYSNKIECFKQCGFRHGQMCILTPLAAVPHKILGLMIYLISQLWFFC